MAPNPWPREVDGRPVDKLFDREGRALNTWFVPSATTDGVFYRVTFTGAWWTCSHPGAHECMGGAYERPCRHVRAVVAAEQADGYVPRPSAPANVSALVD